MNIKKGSGWGIWAILLIVILLALAYNPASLVPQREYLVTMQRNDISAGVAFTGTSGQYSGAADWPGSMAVAFKSYNDMDIPADHYDSACTVTLNGYYSDSGCSASTQETLNGEVLISGSRISCVISFPNAMNFPCPLGNLAATPVTWSASVVILLSQAPVYWDFTFDEYYEADIDNGMKIVWQYVDEFDEWYSWSDDGEPNDDLIITQEQLDILFPEVQCANAAECEWWCTETNCVKPACVGYWTCAEGECIWECSTVPGDDILAQFINWITSLLEWICNVILGI